MRPTRLHARRPRSIWAYVCLLLLSAQALAATGTTISATASLTGTTTTTTKSTKSTFKHHKAAAAKRFKGEVASVDATAKSFVVHPAKGADVTLKVNDKTNYGPKGKTWDDVKAGAKVSGSYKSNGTDNFATTLHFAAVGGGDDPTCPNTGECPCKQGGCSSKCCDG